MSARQQPSLSPAAAAAASWIERGYLVVPIPLREKKPAIKDWPNLRITAKDLPTYFKGAEQNIGVLLGDAYGSTDVDLDCEEALRAAREFLPDTGLIFGHRSKPSSHWFYRSDPPAKTRQFQDPLKDNKDKSSMLVELRGCKSDGTFGLQTVVPPSIHRDTGEPIEFDRGYDREAAHIEAGVLQSAVARVAAAALLARYWPGHGSRHNAFLALAGTLANAGLQPDAVHAIHRGIYRILWPNPDFGAYASEVTSTIDRRQKGSPTTAFSTLAEFVKPAVINKVLEWLGLSDPVKIQDRWTSDVFSQIPYPKPIGLAGYHGIAGEYIRLVEPHTEADPNHMLLYFLCLAGNMIGRGPHIVAGGDEHFANLFVCAVGSTSMGRKGSATGPVERLFKLVDPTWPARAQASGLSSGEGLIYAVRDPSQSRERQTRGGKVQFEAVESDPGVSDKRLFIRQSELYGALQNMKRTGNNLSAILRESWDRGELNSMTKNSPMRATGAHISIVAGITPEELRRSLTDEIDNGFANRFLWCYSRRSKLLPSGGRLFELDLSDCVDRFGKVIHAARGARDIRRDPEAEELWGRDYASTGMYADLSRERPGLFGIVTARAAPQVLRLALIFALLDEKDRISATHLLAAREVWRYCEESARYIFGEALQNNAANEILSALRTSPNGMSRSEILRRIFGGHKSSTEIEAALAELLRLDLARRKEISRTGGKAPGGRPEERWFAIAK
jgi:Protein of unknown function (DUF3987)/Bifunctional DNA primase/polymerase, N-terminal